MSADTRSIKRQCLRLLPHNPVWLEHRPHGNLDESRQFVDVFRSAWSAIPLSDRRSILAYWRQPCVWLLYSPLIALTPYLQSRHDHPKSIGFCGCRGHHVQYRSDAVSRLLRGDGDALKGLIVHELAHVFGYALEMPGHKIGDDGDGTIFDDAEIMVSDVLASWGLDGWDMQIEQAWRPAP